MEQVVHGARFQVLHLCSLEQNVSRSRVGIGHEVAVMHHMELPSGKGLVKIENIPKII